MTNQIVTHETLAMSSKEIAELTGKSHSNVLRDIRNMLLQVHDLEDNSVLSYQEIQGVTIDHDPHTKRVSEIHLDKDHTLTLLTGYDAKARMKVVQRWQELEGTQRPMSPAEILIHQGQLMLALEREQARQAEAQRRLEQKQEQTERRLDQIETAQDHFTVIGWWRYAKQSGSLPLAAAARMGKQAMSFCRENEIAVGEVPDPRFGTVKTYPKWVLDELFAAQAA